MTTEILQNYPEAWGDEAKRVADAVARLNELKSRGVDTIVDLTVVGLGRYIPRIARVAAETDLNIVVATGLYTYNDVPIYFHYRGPGHNARRTRDHDRHVRPRHRAGHRRHRDQGRDPQVRHRRTGSDARRRAGAAGRRAGAPPDRRADLHAHPRGHPARAGAAAHLRRRGRRPVPRGDRPLRRHHRSRLPRGADRATAPTSAWTGSASTSICRSRTGSTPWHECASAGTPTRWCCPTTPTAIATALPEETVPVVMPNWHYLHIHNDVIPALKDARRHRRADDHDARRQPPQDLRTPGRLLMTAPSRRSARSSPGWPGSPRRAGGHLRGTHADPWRTRRVDQPAGARLRRTWCRRQGDYVTIVLPNSIEWIQAALAAWKLGAVPQPLSARLPDAELEGAAGAAAAGTAGRPR